MDLYKTIQTLYEEKKKLDQVISYLEELEHGGAADAPKRRGRKKMDARARREVSERMRRYWAARRAAAQKQEIKR